MSDYIDVIFTVTCNTGHKGASADPFFHQLCHEFRCIEKGTIYNHGRGMTGRVPSDQMESLQKELSGECTIKPRDAKLTPGS